MNIKKIAAYTVYINSDKNYFWVRLRLEGENEIFDVKCGSMIEVAALADLLRNETHTLFDTETENVVIGWEVTGENHP